MPLSNKVSLLRKTSTFTLELMRIEMDYSHQLTSASVIVSENKADDS